MFRIFQIYFDKTSYKYMDPLFYPYKNESKDGFFENRVMKEIYEKNLSFEGIKYTGVTSWKLTHPKHKKTQLTANEILDYIQKDVDSGKEKDVYIYCPLQGLETRTDNTVNPPITCGIIKSPDIWKGHKSWGIHPFDADKLLNEAKVLPFDLFDGKWQFCHNNFFICRPQVFNEYCKTVLLPFISFFERPDIKQHPASVAWYHHKHEGIEYPSYSFTGEGLFGSFLAHSSYTFDYICKTRIKKKLQWVRIDGYENIN